MPEPNHPIYFDTKGDALCTFSVTATLAIKEDWLRDHGYPPGERGHGRGVVALPRYPDPKRRDACVLEQLTAQARGTMAFHIYKEGLSSRVDLPPEAVERVADVRLSNCFTDDVLAHFFAGTPADTCARLFRQNRTKDRAGRYLGYGLRRGGPMANRGSMRLWYDTQGQLFSYAMCLGLWVQDRRGQRLFLLNGDGAPTKTTAEHQHAVRMYLEDVQRESLNSPLTVTALRPHAIVPFSVLRSAGVDFDALTILDATTAKVRRREEPCRRNDCETKGSHTHPRDDHFLGETLLRDRRGRVFLSGMDRNDAPSKRSFYLCQVPGTPATVEEAIATLRPDGLPQDTPRQGEWFFVPEPGYRLAKDALRTTYCPIAADTAEDQLSQMSMFVDTKRGKVIYRVPSRAGRHVASTLVVNGAVYARGSVRDDEHTTLRLGPVWHRVVKNRAIEGWRYDAVEMRARVD